MIVRQATIDDLPKLEPLAREFYSSSRFLKDFDIERFSSVWASWMNLGVGAIYLLLPDESGPIAGCLGAYVYPEPYSGSIVATEFFWYVSRDHRGHGLDLYYAFEEWARERGASQIRMAHLCDLMPEGMKVLYGELGMEPIETTYAKDLKPWQ